MLFSSAESQALLNGAFYAGATTAATVTATGSNFASTSVVEFNQQHRDGAKRQQQHRYIGALGQQRPGIPCREWDLQPALKCGQRPEHNLGRFGRVSFGPRLGCRRLELHRNRRHCEQGALDCDQWGDDRNGSCGTTPNSATSSGGSCFVGSTITCSLGNIGNGATLNVTMELEAMTVGNAGFSATVSAGESDPGSSNNTGSATTAITGTTLEPVPVVASLSPSVVQAGASVK